MSTKLQNTGSVSNVDPAIAASPLLPLSPLSTTQTNLLASQKAVDTNVDAKKKAVDAAQSAVNDAQTNLLASQEAVDTADSDSLSNATETRDKFQRILDDAKTNLLSAQKALDAAIAASPLLPLSPTQTSLSPTQTSLLPTQTSLSPTQTSLSPTQTSLSPTQTSLSPTQTSLSPTAPKMPVISTVGTSSVKSADSCKFSCPTNSSFTLSCDFSAADAFGVGFSLTKGSMSEMYENMMSGKFIISSTPPFTLPGIIPRGTIINALPNNTIKNSTYTTSCDLSLQSYEWLCVAILLRRFGINPMRLCSVEIKPRPNTNNPTTLRMKFSIGPPILSSDNQLYPYDYANAECIKNVIFAWMSQYDPSSPTGKDNINKTDVESWVNTYGKQMFNQCLNGFTSNVYNDVEYLDDIHIKSIGNLSNIKIENYTSDDVIEHISNMTSVRGATIPTTLFDYLFMYSVPITFIGAMAYAILAVIQTDISSIMINKNVVIASNVYIALCGLFSFCAWFNVDITNISIANFNVSNLFSLAVVKLDSNA
jgi:hypothetical protein